MRQCLGEMRFSRSRRAGQKDAFSPFNEPTTGQTPDQFLIDRRMNPKSKISNVLSVPKPAPWMSREIFRAMRVDRIGNGVLEDG